MHISALLPRLIFVLTLGIVVTAVSARAQTVEYTLPEAIEVVPGKLSVTFADSVAESAAVAFVEDQGYTVEVVNFYPVSVVVASDTLLTAAQIAAYEADPRVRAVQHDAGDPAEVLGGASHEGHTFSLVLDAAVSREAARALAASVPGVRVLDVHKLPNDLVVAVGEDDAAALELLEASPLVAYVTYLAY